MCAKTSTKPLFLTLLRTTATTPADHGAFRASEVSGLGWSIPRRCAEVLAIEIVVGCSAELGGLEVMLRWGRRIDRVEGAG